MARINPVLHEEIVEAASLIVRYPNVAAMLTPVALLEGQLTATLHIEEADYIAAGRFLPSLERHAGRILVNDFGTGVEVGRAMVHGAPSPPPPRDQPLPTARELSAHS